MGPSGGFSAHSSLWRVEGMLMERLKWAKVEDNFLRPPNISAKKSVANCWTSGLYGMTQIITPWASKLQKVEALLSLKA